MARGLEPAFAPGRQVWPLAGMTLADFEPDDPDLAIPHGALQNGVREAPERYLAANHNGLITHRPAEPLAPKPARPLAWKRKWQLALLASCVFHAALALFFIQAANDEVLVEGADFSGVAVLGSPEEMVAAGEISPTQETVDVTMVTMLDAVPVETVDAQPVPVENAAEAADVAEVVTAEAETLKPVEETPAEPVQPERMETVPPEPQAERTEPEAVENAVAETAPEVLATDRAELVEDDNFVQQTAETAEAAKPEPSEVAKAEPAETKPVEPVEEAQPKPAKPARTAEKKPVEEKKPAAEKKVAKPKAEDGKKVAEKAKPKKSGNGGRSEANARRGQAEGQEKGDNRQASRGGSKNGQVGNAAVSNYPGKVRSKLARVARSVRAKGRGEVVVAFAVSSNGGVRSARVARSSGVATIDQAALQAIRKASPFPPIPDGAGRATWEFSVPLAFTR